jgi:hypothetical protein
MTNKVFFAGLATVAFAATTLINVAATKADTVFTTGATFAAGGTGAPKTAWGKSQTVTFGSNGGTASSFTNAAASLTGAGALTVSGGTAGTVKVDGGSIATINVTPTLTGAGAGAIANTNSNGATATFTAANAVQLGSFGVAGAGAIYSATGNK